MSANPFRTEALSYAKAGWPVVPLEPGTDVPIELPAVGSLDETQIIRWWERCPMANVGVVLGIPSGAKRGVCLLHVSPSSELEASNKIVTEVGSPHFSDTRNQYWMFAVTSPGHNDTVLTNVMLRREGIAVMPPSAVGGSVLEWRKGKHFSDTKMSLVPRNILDKIEEFKSSAEKDRPEVLVNNEWEDLLRTEAKTKLVLNTFGNLCMIFRFWDRYSGRMAYDAMKLAPTLDGAVIDDACIGRIRESIEREYKIAPAEENVIKAIVTVASEKSFHPVKRYLESVKWDGMGRIEQVAERVLRIENRRITPLMKKLIRYWFVSAVARGTMNESKVDYALVLMGPQGAKKSSFFDILGGEWFTDTGTDISQKDAMLLMSASWICEWGEIETVTGSKSLGEVKAFIASKKAMIRLPYGKTIVSVPRKAVIVGTTNQPTLLNDPTGSRRFWIIKVDKIFDTELLRAWRDQLWAEAVHIFTTQPEWWLTEEEEMALAEANKEFNQEDAWDHVILDWTSAISAIRSKDGQRKTDFTAHELLSNALGLHQKDMTPAAMHRLGGVLRKLGFVRHKIRPEINGEKLEPRWYWTHEKNMPGYTSPPANSSEADESVDIQDKPFA